MMLYNKPVIMNELVSFATQYGQIQKRLLRDLELPHALLDEAGKVIWTNIALEISFTIHIIITIAFFEDSRYSNI